MLENEGKYSDSVRILDSNNLRWEALSRAASFEKKRIELEPELSTSNLSYMYAKRYARIKDDNTMLLKVLEYMSDTRTKVRFLKEGGLFQEAFETYVKQKQYTDAYRLASARGWHDKGAALARKQEDSMVESSFTFQNVKSKWSSLSPESPELKQLHLLAKGEAKQVKANALLLLGMLKKDIGLCRSARESNRLLRNKVGELEAFNAMAMIADDESPVTVLEVCTLAQSTAEAFGLNPSKQASAKQAAQQASEFYGLHHVSQVYLVPPSQARWLGMDFESCKCEDGTVDLDGMYRLKVTDTKKIIASRFKDFVDTWIEGYNVQTVLNKKLQAFKLHKDIAERKFLPRAYTTAEVPPVELTNYIKCCVHFFELFSLGHPKQPPVEMTKLLLSVFSPQISIYLPLSRQHITPVRKSDAAITNIQDWIKLTVKKQAEERVRIEPWLHAWRACCISNGNTSVLRESLKNQAAEVNRTAGCSKEKSLGPRPGFVPPPGFVLWRNEKQYYHIFFFWIRSCEMMKSGEAFDAAKCAIYNFLSNVKGAFIPVMEVVDVLTVYCTAILAMITHLNYYEGCGVPSVVPSIYKHAIQVFNDLNCYRKEDYWVLKACSETVRRTRKTKQLRSDCMKMLWRALDLLLGLYVREFSVLSYTLKLDKDLNSGASRHCLAIALTLFGNLTQMRSDPPKLKTADYHRRLQSILENSARAHGQQKPTKYVLDALNTLSSPTWMTQVLPLLHRTLQEGDPNASLSHLVVQDNKRVAFLKFATTRPAKPRVPMQQTEPQVPGFPATSVVRSSAVLTHQALSTSDMQLHPAACRISPYSNHHHPQEILQPVLNTAETTAHRQERVTPLLPALLCQPTGELSVPTENVSSEDLRLSFHLPGQPFEPLIVSESPNQLESQSITLGDLTTVSYQGGESVAEGLEYEEDDFSVGLVTEEPDRDEDQSAVPTTSALVDTEFCSVCAVSLCAARLMDEDDRDGEGGTSSNADIDDGIETYQSHIKSKAHIGNEALHKQFMDENKWSLDPLLAELSSVVSECKMVLERCQTYHVNASTLVRAMDNLSQVKDDSERAVSEIESSAEWRKGIETVNEYTDQVRSQVVRCKKELTKINTKVPAAKEVMAGEPQGSASLDTTIPGDESDHEELEEELSRFVDAEPREQLSQSRMSKDKERSRQRKKRRKT